MPSAALGEVAEAAAIEDASFMEEAEALADAIEESSSDSSSEDSSSSNSSETCQSEIEYPVDDVNMVDALEKALRPADDEAWPYFAAAFGGVDDDADGD